jgi:RecA-family ATPase
MLLPKRGKLLLGGESKIGKSFISMQIAKDIALGRTPFGHPSLKVVGRPKILYCEQELGDLGVHSRVQKMFEGVPREQYEGFLFGVPRINLKIDRPLPDFQILDALIEEVQPNIVILDPASKLMHGDDSSNADVNRFFDAVDNLLDKYSALDLSVIITHHFGKPTKDNAIEKLSAYNFRGASKWRDDPDTLITAVRDGQKDPVTKGWNLITRWESRHGQELDDCVLKVHNPKYGVHFSHFYDHEEAEEAEALAKKEKKSYSQGSKFTEARTSTLKFKGSSLKN